MKRTEIVPLNMEMKEALAHPEVQAFMEEHQQADVRQLILKYKDIKGVPIRWVVQQISGRQKAKDKLQRWFNTSGILYPPTINLEQCSSELVAEGKVRELQQESFLKASAVDLTGGFGVDTFFLAKLFSDVTYVEKDAELLSIAKHNHYALKQHNIRYHQGDAMSFLESAGKFDLVYIDPSRRGSERTRVFRLRDCSPDIVTLQHDIFAHANHLLVKSSPLLDLQQGVRELRYVKKILVVSIDNECKELLFLSAKEFEGEPEIIAVNFHHNREDRFSFCFEEEKSASVEFADPLAFLYEPNAAILKAGAFNSVALRWGLKKIHPNTHFYTSDLLVSDFPGRVFDNLVHLKDDPASIKKFFPGGKANVSTRNYPLSAEALRKKLKLKDGGDQYLLAFSGKQSKFLIAATRMK